MNYESNMKAATVLVANNPVPTPPGELTAHIRDLEAGVDALGELYAMAKSLRRQLIGMTESDEAKDSGGRVRPSEIPIIEHLTYINDDFKRQFEAIRAELRIIISVVKN